VPDRPSIPPGLQIRERTVLAIAFHGGVREVTGSCHRLRTEAGSILLDCGMIQGGPERHDRNRRRLPFPVEEIRAVILSHAHTDHAGRVPLLVKWGYQGPILGTRATADLCRIMLADSGKIQEEDARWKIKRLKKKGRDASWVTPLYTEEEALQAAERIQTVELHEELDLDGVGALVYHRAGHILGAAMAEVRVDMGSGRRVILFSGDLGVDGARLMGPPESVERPDYLLMESTYGDRRRAEEGDRTELLFEVIRSTADRGGKVIIPAFAVGRTQEVLARINDLVEGGRLSGLPVFVDSPMATAVTRVFTRHPEAYSPEARRLLEEGDEPLEFPGLRMVSSVQESMEINHLRGPAVIISSSGMCTAGRVKHHLSHHISDPENTVLFVGYQASNTLGRLIQTGVSPVRIFNEWHPVEAEIRTIEGFSAHADLDELLAWYDSLGGVRRQTFLVHGEEESLSSLGARLRKRGSESVVVPDLDQEFRLE
jgi:metallo-beta-lactamase family protein